METGVIDLNTDRVIHTTNLEVGARPSDVVITPDGRTLYITCDGKLYSLAMEVRGGRWADVPNNNQPPTADAGLYTDDFVAGSAIRFYKLQVP